MATIPDQRKHPRHPALYAAKYTIASETYRDAVENISAGGIYIRTRRAVEQGQRISLRFPIVAFDQRPSVEGRVIRAEANGFAVMFDQPIETGMPLT